jgi:hypothetical protein
MRQITDMMKVGRGCRALLGTALLGIVGLGMAPGLVQAQGGGVALRMGSTGAGIEYGREVRSNLSVRGGFGMLPAQNVEFTIEDESVDLDIAAGVSMQTFHLMVDYAPVAPWMRLSAGMIYNTLAVDVQGAPVSNYTFGARTFTPSQIGTVAADVEYARKVSPYVGIGLGGLTSGRRVGVILDAGIAFTGSMAVDFRSTGMLEPMAEQEALIQEALDGIKIFPAISLGFAIRL